MIEPTQPFSPGPGAYTSGALAGRRAGPYELVEEIGRGGMGIVYRAVRTDGLFEKDVAVKLLLPETSTGFSPERFERERRILASLSHPHIATLLDAGVMDEGLPFLIMEHVPGQPIDAYCDQAGLGLPERLELIRAICLAVHYAHQRLVIHRDIKPANILVTPEGVPKLLDFGIAKLLSPDSHPASEHAVTSTRAMTLEYASPEQVRGEVVTTASDVYSLGVLAYRLLAGRSPYHLRSHSVGELVTAICEQDPQRPSTAPHPEASAAATGRSTAVLGPPWRHALRGDVDRIVLRAMRKEPAERYDSAKALADDIGRFLGGQPVHAHTAGLAYLVGKRLRKHRVATVVTASALVIGMVAAGLGVQARRSADRQVRLAQELGGEVERMEWVMRAAHLLPLHDIRREKAMVLERMAWIEGRMQALGRLGEGPGHAALGRGLFSLGRFEEARVHLDRAWQAGSRQPEVAHALGLALASRYWQEKLVADRIANPEARKARRQACETSFRDPALALLREGRTTGTAPDYASGFIARLEGRYEEAIRRARTAAAELPWLYEAHLLEGDCWVDLAVQRRDTGDEQGSIDALDHAEQAYGESARLAPSDPRPHIRQLHLAKLRLQRKAARAAEDPAPELAGALAAGDAATQADPGDPDTYWNLAEACFLHAEWAMATGHDPRPSLERAVDTALRGTAVEPVPANTFAALGTARAMQGRFEAMRGHDPRPALGHAMDAYRRGEQKDAGNLQVLIGMGNTARFLAEYQIGHGEDPRPALEEAAASYRHAIEIVPDAANFHNNHGIVLQVLGTYELAHGRDPSRSLEEAVRAHRRALELNPNHGFAANNLGNDLQQVALYELTTGRDPEPSLRASEDALQKAAEIAPRDAIPHVNLIYGYRLRAEHERLSGRDPSPGREIAERTFETARRLNPQQVEAYTYMAGVDLVVAQAVLDAGRTPAGAIAHARSLLPLALAIDPSSAEAHQLAGRAACLDARWRTMVRQPAADAFDLAARELEQAARINPDDATIWRDLAEVRRWRAESPPAAPSPDLTRVAAEVSSGLQAAGRALAINPALAEALVTRGALHRLAAAASREPERIGAARQEARTDLETALRINLFVRREVEPLLAGLT